MEQLHTITPESPALKHVLIRGRSPQYSALISSQGAGTPRAVTLAGYPLMPMGPAPVEDPKGDRGEMRMFSHLMMFPGGSNGPFMPADADFVEDKTGVRFYPFQKHGRAGMRPHGFTQTIDATGGHGTPSAAEFELRFPGSDEYIWPFHLSQKHSWIEDGTAYRREITVTNTGTDPMFLNLGLHDFLGVQPDQMRAIRVTEAVSGRELFSFANYNRPDDEHEQPAYEYMHVHLGDDAPVFEYQLDGDFRDVTFNSWTDMIGSYGPAIINTLIDQQIARYPDAAYYFEANRDGIVAYYQNVISYACPVEVAVPHFGAAYRHDRAVVLKPGELRRYGVTIRAV
ncbi:MAG: hypothetical protein TR69_WS6001000068 [candidate division WS6 bacterium OLB20]|uniref:Aldose 1-epimerase n=1 Tax=candidate division WS6 bacterium OLB20 TaxID=1617426 RepID=A0A136M146_9BACT|nr:MAG: hypothetical protein TR69_WS6001000068 [candidate division WS6 bacterium OLB20]